MIELDATRSWSLDVVMCCGRLYVKTWRAISFSSGDEVLGFWMRNMINVDIMDEKVDQEDVFRRNRIYE